LHILNFTTTLAPSTISRHESRQSLHPFTDSPIEIPRVDITSPAISNVLKSLAALHLNGANTSFGDLLVEIAQPVYIFVVPPGPRALPSSSKPSDIIENFMSAWTRLVGDPLLSKWIVLVLAGSLVLNGYLLKGIAEGAIRGIHPQNVRFRSVQGTKIDKDSDDKDLSEPQPIAHRRRPLFAIGDDPIPVPNDTKPAITPDPLPPSAPTAKPILAPIAVHPTSENGVPAFLLDMKLKAQSTAIVRTTESKEKLPPRSLDECIDIFENGPRPVQASLATLNDEEVVLLAQNGKVAPYALEKVLGDLERAVVIRRALICKYPHSRRDWCLM